MRIKWCQPRINEIIKRGIGIEDDTNYTDVKTEKKTTRRKFVQQKIIQTGENIMH